MTSLLLVIFSLSALVFIIYVAQGSSPSASTAEEFTRLLKHVDVEGFRNLMDPAETAFLRRSLSPEAFRYVQRKRLRAAICYLRTVADNCAILLHMAGPSRSNTDPQISIAAAELARSAVQLRLYALLTTSKLFFAILFPMFSSGRVLLADRYQGFAARVLHFISLSAPAQTNSFSNAL